MACVGGDRSNREKPRLGIESETGGLTDITNSIKRSKSGLSHSHSALVTNHHHHHLDFCGKLKFAKHFQKFYTS